MALDYKNFKYGDTPISSDSDTIDAHLIAGRLTPTAPDVSDLVSAAEWLALYQTEIEDSSIGQSFANVIAFLQLTAQSKQKRSVLAQAKREYAKTHGIPVSQVRIKKESK